MLNHGEKAPATKNFDDVHREELQSLAEEQGLQSFTEDELHSISWNSLHNLTCWPDFPAVLPKLEKRIAV